MSMFATTTKLRLRPWHVRFYRSYKLWRSAGLTRWPAAREAWQTANFAKSRRGKVRRTVGQR